MYTESFLKKPFVLYAFYTGILILLCSVSQHLTDNVPIDSATLAQCSTCLFPQWHHIFERRSPVTQYNSKFLSAGLLPAPLLPACLFFAGFYSLLPGSNHWFTSCLSGCSSSFTNNSGYRSSAPECSQPLLVLCLPRNKWEILCFLTSTKENWIVQTQRKILTELCYPQNHG